MKTFWVRKIFNIALYLLTFVVLEMLMYGFMYGEPFSDYAHLDIIFASFFLLPSIFIHGKKFDSIYFSIILFIILVLGIANVNFYRFFGDIFSLQYISLVQNGAGTFKFSYIDWVHAILSILTFISFVVVIILFNIHFKEKEMPKPRFNHRLIACLSIFSLSISSYAVCFSVAMNSERAKAFDEVAFEAVTMTKSLNFENFGMLAYYIREIEYLSFDISQETESNLIEYFSSPYESVSSNFTGKLKDYNVVTIMIETGDTLMIDETLTPNLYQLLNNGIYARNNYSKNKTNVSEMIGIVGSSSTAGIDPLNNDYVLPFSIPNMLPDYYNTMYFHDTGGGNDIYQRDILMKEYGFDDIYLSEQINPDLPEWGWAGDYNLDSITMNRVTDFILENKDGPFYAFYTSLSMHGPYADSKNQDILDEKYREKLEQAKEDGSWTNVFDEDDVDASCIETYMMAAMDFDAGLGHMLSRFEEEGELDNTLFVLFGDHDMYYPGYSGEALNLKTAGYEDRQIDNYDIYDTVLGFYNPYLNQLYRDEKNTGFIDKFTSPYVVVPSILDLLGVDYNPKFYIGDSIFSPQFENNPQLIFSLELSSFFNDEYWTYDGYTIHKEFKPSDSEKFLLQVQEIMKKQARLDLVYTHNIFKTESYSKYNP